MGMPLAWQEGYDACRDDLETDDCPYDFASPAWLQWMAGYEAYMNEGNEND